MLKTIITCTVILIMAPIFGFAQDMINNFEKILIRNVTVIDQSQQTEDMVVSILIEQKKLELISQDKIPLSEADITLDAKGGFILGKLEVGIPAAFIILNMDPRLDVDIMLDTKSYSVFAVSKGNIVLNKLKRIDTELNGRKSSWRSYAPPPIALPISYQNKRKWNVFRTKPVTIVLFGAVIMENTRWLSQDPINEEQVGDLSEFVGGSVRGFRGGLAGTFNFEKPWTYIFSFGTRAFERGFEQGNLNEFVTYDYRIDIPLGKARLSLGKQRETISIQRLSPLIYLPSQQERASVADGLLPARNVGIVYNNSAVEDRITWAAGVFNNWFDAGTSFSNTPTVITGRITGLPYISEDESNLLHLGIAGRYSNAAGGIQYKAKTEIFRGPVSVNTGLLDDAESSFHLGLEAAWRKGPFILSSEYIQSNVTSVSYNDPAFNGYYVVASYIFTGEMRKYDKRSGIFKRVNIANEVTSGGWGTWEVFGRLSSIDLNDGSIDGGKMKTFSLGLNWWPVTSIQVNVNYRYSELDRYGQTGFNHGLVTRLSFVLE